MPKFKVSAEIILMEGILACMGAQREDIIEITAEERDDLQDCFHESVKKAHFKEWIASVLVTSINEVNDDET